MLLLLSQVLTIQERRRLESIPTQLRIIPNTNPINLISGCLGSPLLQLRNKFVGPPSTALSGSPLCQVVKSHLWTYANGSPHILTTDRVRTFTSRLSA